MSHFVPSCHVCGALAFYYPSGCSNSDCKLSVTFQFKALRAAAQALVTSIRDLEDYEEELMALEAALKAVGS